MDLILDVKIYIASFDEDVWIKLVLVDEEFKCYAYNNLTQFVNLFTNVVTEKDKTNIYLLGKLHSINDLPAITEIGYQHWYSNVGYQHWYYNGKQHKNNDLPASIHNGHKFWYHMGLAHRDNDLPATIFADGTKYWWYNGLQHRDNDLPAVIYKNGTKEWWIMDRFIRG